MRSYNDFNVLRWELGTDQNKAAYHNTKLLLSIYSSAVWNTRDTVDELLNSYSEAYDGGDIAALECLVSMYEGNSVRQLESRLRCVVQNKIMIDIVEKNMLHVREYPYHGELYYNILNKNYFVRHPYTETEILEALCLSRSTYYRRRKDAITTFGISMWGYMLPQVLRKMKSYRETFLRQN